jgi:hypothetical protein
MIHLTLTGYYAGRPLCDCNKSERQAAGDTFQHAIYCHELASPEMCKECLSVWNAADEVEVVQPTEVSS